MSTRYSSDGDDPTVTLYRLHGCPYCERVVRWLDDHDVAYRSRFVAGEHSRRDEVARTVGTRSVPVLIDHATGVTMPESGNILEYLVRTYGTDGETGTVGDLDVVQFSASSHPVEGEVAPNFTRPLVTAESWADVSLSDLATDAGGVLLVFYPLNWGGKSMYWWKEIQRRGWDAADVEVIGVGISQPFDHQRFIESRDLPYPLYSDPGTGSRRPTTWSTTWTECRGFPNPVPRPSCSMLTERSSTRGSPTSGPSHPRTTL